MNGSPLIAFVPDWDYVVVFLPLPFSHNRGRKYTSIKEHRKTKRDKTTIKKITQKLGIPSKSI